ncbi:MAG: peptidylprolyl isomerase [Thermodesulfobacteriota bacterium]
MKRTIAAFVLTLLIGAWATPPCEGEVYSDRVAAVVNGSVILVSDIHRYKNPFIRSLVDLGLNIVPPGKWPTEKEILDELIVFRLLEQEADKAGVKVEESEVDNTIESIIKRNKITHDQFVLHLAANKLNYADYREIMKRQFKLRKLMQKEVAQKIPLSEADAQEYFKENRNRIDEQFKELQKAHAPAHPVEPTTKFEIPTHETIYTGGKVRLKQITLKIDPANKQKSKANVEAKAKRIFQEASTGADFGQLAKKYSEDNLARSGGDLGVMDYKDLVPNLQNLVQRMKKGDVTPPLGAGQNVIIFHLAEATGRQEKKVPIPAAVRKRYEQELEKRRKEIEARRKPNPEHGGDDPDHGAGPPDEKAAPVKNLGVLNPDEAKEYAKVRQKVYAIVTTKTKEARSKEWIEELKKNSIIEVKI